MYMHEEDEEDLITQDNNANIYHDENDGCDDTNETFVNPSKVEDDMKVEIEEIDETIKKSDVFYQCELCNLRAPVYILA